MKKKLVSFMLIGCCMTAAATEIEFSYNSSGMSPYGFGFSKQQTYDVGIALNSEHVTGKKILSMSVPVFNIENVSNTKVWLSKELTASKGNESVFTPDIASYDVMVSEGAINFTFAEPYLIPEDGIFIGYSLSSANAADGDNLPPIAVTDGNSAGGMWIHTNVSQQRWADYAVRNNLISAITVTLEGEFPQDKASFTLDNDHIYAAIDEPSTANLSITNWGENEITSFDYVYKVGDKETAGSYVFSTPIPSILGRSKIAELEILPQSNLGEYNYEVKIVKINGKESQLTNTESTPLTVQPFLATYRPLVEEYTGRSCGWCPKGYVMMEQMKHNYGNRFVGLAYHTYGQDGMYCIENPPLNPSGFPSASFNRGGQIAIESVTPMWLKNYKNNAPAEIEVDLNWKDESHKILVATARARFINEIKDCNYKFSIALLADSLSRPTWWQSNSYFNYEAKGEYTGPFWDLFIGKSDRVYGLVYNDVVVHYPNYKGEDGSLPANIEAEKWYEFTYEIDTDEVKNLDGDYIVSNFNRTRVVAMIVAGKNGEPINCASSDYPDGNSPFARTEEIEVDANIIDSIYYDINGRIVANPTTGLYIKINRMSDGSFNSEKIICR